MSDNQNFRTPLSPFPTQYDPTRGIVTTAAPTPSYGLPNSNPNAFGPRTTFDSGNRIPGSSVASGDFGNFPGNWWNDIPQASFGDIINNPDQFTRMWAKAGGLGEHSIQQLQSFAPAIDEYLYGMGKGKSFEGMNYPEQRQAQMQTDFLHFILEPGKYIDPRHLVNTALVSALDANGKAVAGDQQLASRFGDPSVAPANQVSNFLSYVKNTVANLLPTHTAQAYLQNLQQIGNRYLDYMTANPNKSVPFNKFVYDILGPSGGI